MEIMKYFSKIVIAIAVIFFSSVSLSLAAQPDFIIDNSTEFNYKTGDNFVTVTTEYIRTVKNSSYFFPAEGERIFHIPDANITTEEENEKEREFKLTSLSVVGEDNKAIQYSIEKLPNSEGMYIKVKNYKETKSGSPYKIYFSYKTHDYVIKSGTHVTLVGTSLPKDISFEDSDEKNKTVTKYNYSFAIVTDKSIPKLSKAFPTFTKSENSESVHYNFSQTDRIDNYPMLEFGTSATYRFELKNKTPKTDNLIPQNYSNIFKSSSTNIYVLSLPREFSETNQKVLFDSISPTPRRIYLDEEGNILATFEVPANKESEITVSGYITVEQSEYETPNLLTDVTYEKYLNEIASGNQEIKKYLNSTKYWQTKDAFIQDIANKLSKDAVSLMDIIKRDYQYLNETLEYDSTKANSNNERIGAVAALSGGASVCMEYADSMIAILRAQGIPARAALGYANIPERSEGEEVRHQWVQIWLPNYGWLSVDPTFESKNMKIGQMIDRVLWETFNNDTLSNIMLYSADKVTNLDSKDFSLNIYAVSSIPNISELKKYDQLLGGNGKVISNQTQYKIDSWFETFLKATTLGRALVITIPILISIAVIVVSITLVKVLLQKRSTFKNQKKNEKEDKKDICTPPEPKSIRYRIRR